ncbi:MAG: hypothetical protein LBL23_06365 [Coriobacteriales bacterium]|jgi:drug/metabolite transporter (DMT)-like permease|nr:hypothetical protein [Coriobacteriales bacterium]
MTTDSARIQRAAKIRGFFIKGVSIAVLSGMLYGIYSSCLLAATGSGEWATWYGSWYLTGSEASINGAIMSFAMACLILGALGSGINDFISAIWMVAKAGVKGKFRDFLRCFKSKPGLVMVICAIIGGPIASTAYLIALTMSGPIATPVSALCPAIGAIIGRFLFKQQLNARMLAGIVICVVATFMIGSSAFTGIEVNMQFLLGLAIALIAALGWGIEGSVAGFGTSVMDYEIGISIRQTTSGIFTLFVLTPALFIISGHLGLYPTMLFEAFEGPLVVPDTIILASPLVFFLISGLAAGLSFGFWYKGNSMCGAALGMACNGAFSFWVPFFSFLICGLYLGWGYVDGSLDASTGYVLTPIQWAAAIVMVVGIFLIAVNPLRLFRETGQLAEAGGPVSETAQTHVGSAASEGIVDTTPADRLLPFNYAILRLFEGGGRADSQQVMEALRPRYAHNRQFNDKTVSEALMTAEQNGLLEETGYELASNDELRVYYQATAEGREMIAKYIG